MPEINGYAHVAITVSDLDASLAFYEKLFGAGPVGRIELDGLDRRLFSVGNGQILGVTAYTEGKSVAFDPTVPGLDHIGFAVSDRDAVVAWQEHASAAGIDSDLEEPDFGTTLMVKDPDGNQIEFFAAAPPELRSRPRVERGAGARRIRRAPALLDPRERGACRPRPTGRASPARRRATGSSRSTRRGRSRSAPSGCRR